VFGDNHRLEKKLRESGGVCAEATILKKREGAIVENQNWKGERRMAANWHLTVHVAAPGGEFETSFVQRIDAGATGLLQAGMVQSIPVIFDPNDHKKIALDQEAWGERTRAQSWSGATTAIAAQPAAAAPAAEDHLQALSRLADLRDRGVLTDEEFEAQKAKLLGS
jgi:Short C-terminal domain